MHTQILLRACPVCGGESQIWELDSRLAIQACFGCERARFLVAGGVAEVNLRGVVTVKSDPGRPAQAVIISGVFLEPAPQKKEEIEERQELPGNVGPEFLAGMEELKKGVPGFEAWWLGEIGTGIDILSRNEAGEVTIAQAKTHGRL